MEICFVLFANQHRVGWGAPPKVKELGLDQYLVEKTLDVISLSLPELQVRAKELIEGSVKEKNKRVAYLPSILRKFPVIRALETNDIICPLPELIIFRATAGLYFDIRLGPQQLTTEANERFEEYTRTIIQAYCPRFQAFPSEKYGPKGARIDTPDVLIDDNGEVGVVIECKATKLTYEAQFAENPIAEAENAYNQIAKGVFQLWRFFSHVRRGVYVGKTVSNGVVGIVLTMESWVQASADLQKEVLTRAKLLATKDPEIIDADMRTIIFCPIQDLVDVLVISTEDDVLATVASATKQEHIGWGVRELRQKIGSKNLAKKFPLNVDEVIPWWSKYRR